VLCGARGRIIVLSKCSEGIGVYACARSKSSHVTRRSSAATYQSCNLRRSFREGSKQPRQLAAICRPLPEAALTAIAAVLDGAHSGGATEAIRIDRRVRHVTSGGWQRRAARWAFRPCLVRRADPGTEWRML